VARRCGVGSARHGKLDRFAAQFDRGAVGLELLLWLLMPSPLPLPLLLLLLSF